MEPLSPDEPRHIGPYAIEGRLGVGGMGCVYLGRSRGGHRVAVKVIHQHLALDSFFRERLAREVAAAKRVTSAFTAQLIDSEVDDPRSPWIATRFIEGPSLADSVARFGPMPTERAIDVAAGIAEALSAIHAAGVVHRDLKPGNVILAVDGPHVIDFGIARLDDRTRLTSAGSVLGTVAYMSPEQASGEDVGWATDIYSLGAVLFFCLTGRSPFDPSEPASDDRPGQSPGTLALLYRIVTEDPPLDGVRHPSVRALVAACLAKKRATRPPAEEFLNRCNALTADLDTTVSAPAGPRPRDGHGGEPGQPDDATPARRAVRDGLALFSAGALIDAEREFRRAVTLDPSAFDAWMGLGDSACAQSRHAEAERAYRTAINLEPQTAAAHIGLADAVRLQGRYGEAAEGYREALGLDPREARAWTGLGEIRRGQGRYTAAEDAYGQAIRLDPNDAQAHAGLGDTLRALEVYKDAEDAYHEAIRLDPGYGYSRTGLGDTLRAQERFAEAEAAYQEAIGLGPEDLHAHLGLGDALWFLGRYSEAETAFRRATSLAPENVEALLGLADALRHQQRHTQAATVYRDALRLAPDNACVLTGLGATFLDGGQLTEAERVCRRAAQLHPDDPTVHYGLSSVLHALGRRREAGAAYARALRLDLGPT